MPKETIIWCCKNKAENVIVFLVKIGKKKILGFRKNADLHRDSMRQLFSCVSRFLYPGDALSLCFREGGWLDGDWYELGGLTDFSSLDRMDISGVSSFIYKSGKLPEFPVPAMWSTAYLDAMQKLAEDLYGAESAVPANFANAGDFFISEKTCPKCGWPVINDAETCPCGFEKEEVTGVWGSFSRIPTLPLNPPSVAPYEYLDEAFLFLFSMVVMADGGDHDHVPAWFLKCDSIPVGFGGVFGAPASQNVAFNWNLRDGSGACGQVRDRVLWHAKRCLPAAQITVVTEDPLDPFDRVNFDSNIDRGFLRAVSERWFELSGDCLWASSDPDELRMLNNNAICSPVICRSWW